MSVDEKLILKIKGLLDTSTERGASEAEAASAARLVEGLLLKHGLRLEDVKEEVDKVDGQNNVQGLVFSVGKGSNEELIWLIALSDFVARLCFCRGIVQRDIESNAAVGFIGSPTDAKAALDLCKWLVERGEKLALVEWEKTQQPTTTIMSGNGYFTITAGTGGMFWGASRDKDLFLRSFLLGYSQRLGSKIAERLNERQEESQTTALVVSRLAEADSFIERTFGGKLPNMEPVKQSTVDHDAMYRGVRAGSESELEVAGVLV